MKYKELWRKAFEHGSHRPYTALLYMGFIKIPESVWKDATIYANGGNNRITAMYASSSSFLIIYE